MRYWKPAATALAVVMILAACSVAPGTSTSPSSQPSMAGHSMSPSQGAGTADIESAAANLRTDLNYLLGEHLILAAKATGAALGGRADQFAAYGALLNTNGTDLGAAIGSIYGQAAQDEWNLIWSQHNGFFVDYTNGVATKDQAAMDLAVKDLTTVYVPQFAEFLAGATDLPQDVLETLITDHVLTTKAIVDAQGAGDVTAAATADREAAQHMRMLGDPLAVAIVGKVPDKF